MNDGGSSNAGQAPIEARFFFIWFGERLPLFAEIALRSAHRHHPEASIVLYHLGLSAKEQSRLAFPWLELKPIDPEALIVAAQKKASAMGHPRLNVERLKLIWQRLSTPASRANIVRLLALYAEGGVYLDTDTLTVRDLSPLFQLGAFCGEEYILWPQDKLNKLKSYFWTTGPALSVLRHVLSLVPAGYRLERQFLQRNYTRAVNNAVLGASSGHPHFHRAIEAATQVSNEDLTRPFRLGTHLLQSVLGETVKGTMPRIVVLSPEHFYPLGPVISQHYFREVSDVEKVTAQMMSEDTYVIHWYASVSNLLRLDEQRIYEERRRTPFAYLCTPYLER